MQEILYRYPNLTQRKENLSFPKLSKNCGTHMELTV